MKQLLIIIIALGCCFRLSAQAQEIQQLRLDIEKLAQFKLMLSEMKQGYQVLQNGYNSVRDAAKGNFNLHRDYLDGLLKVNPSLKNSPSVKQGIALQTVFINEYTAGYQQLAASGYFSPTELQQFKSNCSQMQAEMSDDMDAVALVLTPGNMRMSDAERIGVIDQLHQAMELRLSGLRELIKTNQKMLVLRVQQKRDMEAVKKLSGL